MTKQLAIDIDEAEALKKWKIKNALTEAIINFEFRHGSIDLSNEAIEAMKNLTTILTSLTK